MGVGVGGVKLVSCTVFHSKKRKEKRISFISTYLGKVEGYKIIRRVSLMFLSSKFHFTGVLDFVRMTLFSSFI